MEKPDTQPDLTARIDEQLKATEGHTTGPWVADYVGDNSYLVSSVTPGTIDGNLRQVGLITHMPDDARMEDAALIASAPTLRALLVEARAQLAAQAEALANLRNVLDRETIPADALAQSETMRHRHKAMGRHHVIRELRDTLGAHS